MSPSLRLRHPVAGLTLVELCVVLALLSYLMLVLFSATDAAGHVWRNSQVRTEAVQSARTTLELLVREITPAVVDTRTQLVVGRGEDLLAGTRAQVAPESPALLWMAPLGPDGDLRCVGYYLYRDSARHFYRLKRMLIGPTDAKGDTSPLFPPLGKQGDPREAKLRPRPDSAEWFTSQWKGAAFAEEETEDASAEVVSTVADGVVAFWVQSFDLLGNPIPVMAKAARPPRPGLFFNSAAFFHMATTTPYEAGVGVQYLLETPQTMRANRVPAAMEFTLVTVDAATLRRHANVPTQEDLFDRHHALDVAASLKRFQEALQAEGIHTARTFTSRAHLLNGN